ALSNPYLVCALLIHAGLYGIENHILLPEEMDEASAYLPGSRKEAGGIAAKSAFIRDIIPEGVLRKYTKS
nr:glutamine synthetase [Lachnospiraceae bacterium]